MKINFLKGRNKILYILVFISILTSVSSVYCININTQRLEEKVNNLENTIYNMQGDVSNSVKSSINNAMDSIVEQTADITDYDTFLGEFNNGEFPLEISVTPHTYSDGMSAKFLITNDDNEAIEIEGIYDGIAFKAETKVPAWDVANIDVQFSSRDTITNAHVSSVYPKEEISLDFKADSCDIGKRISLNHNGNLFVKDTICTDIFYCPKSDYSTSKAQPKIKSCSVITYINEKELFRDKIVLNIGNNNYATASTDYNHTFKVAEGQQINIVVEAIDSNNIQYRSIVDLFKIYKDSEGDLHFEADYDSYTSTEYLG